MKKIILLIFCFFVLITKINAETIDYAKGAKSAILMEASTNEILFEKNSSEQLSIASMTKIMTILLTMEALEDGKIKLDDMVNISTNASSMGGTQIFVKENTTVVLSDLLKGITIASANDAAVAVAEYIGGSEENFVKMMNDRAKELGAKNTNFKNPHGLDEKDHYSTAYDMALIASELIKHENALKLTSTYEEYITVNGEKHWLVNTNKLVRFYDGVDGLKTGYTDDAGYCLTATKKRNNMRLISVVIKESDKETRNTDTIKMLEYGFSMYNIEEILDNSKSLGKIYVNKSNKKYFNYYLKNNINILVDKNTKNLGYKLENELFDVEAPLKKGDIVGRIYLIRNNKTINYDLIIKENIEKETFIQNFANNFRNILSGFKVK